MADSEFEYKGLKHRTRANANPQGRPRVYFCCHPNDFGAYFEPVATEILDAQTNAAIWYYDPSEGIPDSNELLDDLRQMQLFVIPVTSRFVYQESQARTVELALAVESHIPVLPLMQEDIPNRDFSRACGSLQTLNRFTSLNDPTTIPYEERLKTFLQSVLVGDELAERVRAAFDAYVFLSYRKKDRAQAQRVMRLIHEDPLCRDIAIWYDEFLVPGENFRNAIRDALEKCSVFSLVVTPNLLEPNNFVMREEYPAARNSGKPVVPVEAVETDHAEFFGAYPGIVETVLPDDEGALPAHMLESLRDVALRENDQDPQHNFFIGLAYLTGIDVEVNHERALSLITSAAEAGLPEAYERLVAMYNTGEGVERDYHKAIEWQERYVESLRKRAKQAPILDNRGSLFQELQYLGDLSYEVADYARALDAYEMSFSIVNSLKSEVGRATTLSNLSTILGKMGDVHRNLFDLEGALALHARALSIAEYRASGLPARNWPVYQKLALSLTKLGNDYHDLGHDDEALSLYKRALEIREDVASELNSDGADIDLFCSLYKAATTLRILNRPHEAITMIERAIEVIEPVTRETRSVMSRRCLGIGFGELSVLLRATGNTEDALLAQNQSVAIHQELAEESGSITSLHDLSVDYRRIADTYGQLDDLKNALAYYTKALEVDEKIANDTGNAEALRDLVSSLDRVGDFREQSGDLEGALTLHERALKIEEALESDVGITRAHHNVKTALTKIEEIRGALDIPEGDLLPFEQYPKTPSTGSGNIGTRWLSYTLDRIGSLRQELGDLEGASSAYERALRIDEKLALEDSSSDARRNLSVSLDKVGDIRRSLGDLEGALCVYECSADIRSGLASESDTTDSRRELAYSLDRVGGLRRELGDLEGASSAFERALEVDEEIASEDMSVDARRNLSVSLNRVGDIRRSLGDPKGAISAYERSVDIRDALASETGTADALRDLIYSLDRLAITERVHDKLEAAYSHFLRSIAIGEELASLTESLQDYESLAATLENASSTQYALGETSIARNLHEQSLKIDMTLAEHALSPYQHQGDKEQMVFELRQIANSYMKTGDSLSGTRRSRDSKGWFEKAVLLYDKITLATNDSSDLREFARSCSLLGWEYLNDNLAEEALIWFEKESDLLEKALMLTDEHKTWCSLGESCYRILHTLVTYDPAVSTEQHNNLIHKIQSRALAASKATGEKRYANLANGVLTLLQQGD